MSTRDRLLAAVVAVGWGLNFLAVRIALDHLPPFFLAGLRYAVLAVPVVLFVRRPAVPARWLVAYGLTFGTMQFGLLFLAIDAGMPTGLSSVVIQAAAPFTVLLAVPILGERVGPQQWSGVALAVAGLAVIAVDRSQVAAVTPMALTVLAALAWALGNIAVRQARPDSPFRFALWMSVIPPLPLFAMSAVREGPTTGWRALGEALHPAGWGGLVALAYIVVVGTVVGSGIWATLLRRNPAGAVASYSMLVPVIGMAAAWGVLGERPGALAVLGGSAVVAGVVLGTRRAVSRRGRPPAIPPNDRAGGIPSRR